MNKGKIIDFPVPDDYYLLMVTSAEKLQVLIEALNLANEKGILTEYYFQGLVDYCNVDVHRDFTNEDRAILQFHIDNYYGLKIQI